MQALGVYLIYTAIILRTVVVLADEPEFPIALAFLAGYGLLLIGGRWLASHRLQSTEARISYLFLQSVLVVGVLIISSYEDFLAMLFVPLSLDAVTFFGRQAGFMSIAILSLVMILTLLFSDVGPFFGLVMGILYSGICFLVGGYAYQVQSARAVHDQNMQMFSELQSAHQQLQEYADQVKNLAIEHERSRLARELHDSVTQTVFSMNLAAQSAHLLLEKESPRAAGQLLRLEELAAGALSEIQSLVSKLSPRADLEEDLPSSLRRLAVDQKIRSGLQVSLEIHGERTLSPAVATSLYSITHEALINIVKHSGVCEAIVRLDLTGNPSCLEIEDHGRGFDQEAARARPGHLGIADMSERAGEIGWELSVLSRPGQGTRILVQEVLSRGSE